MPKWNPELLKTTLVNCSVFQVDLINITERNISQISSNGSTLLLAASSKYLKTFFSPHNYFVTLHSFLSMAITRINTYLTRQTGQCWETVSDIAEQQRRFPVKYFTCHQLSLLLKSITHTITFSAAAAAEFTIQQNTGTCLHIASLPKSELKLARHSHQDCIISSRSLREKLAKQPFSIRWRKTFTRFRN